VIESDRRPHGARRALIAGASGLVGGEVLRRLLSGANHPQVHALVRRPLAGPGLDAAAAAGRLVQHTVDFATLARWRDFPPVDDVFVCLGTTLRAAGSHAAFRRVDFDAVVAVARIARRHGATRLAVVSALGADPGSRVFYNRVKGESELARLDYPSLIVLRPSLLDGPRTETRPGERAALLLSRPFARLIPARLRPVPASAVARCMVDAMRDPQPGLRIIESDRIQAHAG
jgi:uncharacterized protein YbjT (DUF2867 family)